MLKNTDPDVKTRFVTQVQLTKHQSWPPAEAFLTPSPRSTVSWWWPSLSDPPLVDVGTDCELLRPSSEVLVPRPIMFGTDPVGFTGIPFPHSYPRVLSYVTVFLKKTIPQSNTQDQWVDNTCRVRVVNNSCLSRTGLYVNRVYCVSQKWSSPTTTWVGTCTFDTKKGASVSGITTLSKMWSSHQILYPQNPYPSVVFIVGTEVPGGFFVQGFHRPSDMEIR
jgi:hypothetical protein